MSRTLTAVAAAAALTLGLLGPASAVAGSSPLGYLESVSAAGNRVTVAGWAFDRDNLSYPDPVSVYQTYPTRVAVATAWSGVARSDVDRAYAISGNHGFQTQFWAQDGTRTYCAYALNIPFGSGNANRIIGCRTITIHGRPMGHLDGVSADAATFGFHGWAWDPANPSGYAGVWLTVSQPGRPLNSFSMEGWTDRADVDAALHIHAATGFDGAVIVVPGANRVCASVIPLMPGSKWVPIGCATIFVSAADTARLPVTAPDTTAATPSSVTEQFSPSADQFASGITVRRMAGTTAPVSPTDGQPVAELPSTAKSFTDSGLQAGTTYSYGMFTHDAAGKFASAHATASTAGDHLLWGWGNDLYGQVGNELPYGADSLSYPSESVGLVGVAGATGDGRQASFAWMSDGTALSWGAQANGELGNGVTSNHATGTPARIPGLAGVTAMAAGGGSGFALHNDGSVSAWGNNVCGALGDGTTTSTSTPHTVPGLTGVTAISATQRALTTASVFALKSDGTVWAWGLNSLHQLGMDTPSVCLGTPTQIPGLSGITAISAGQDGGLARAADGSVYGWGTTNAPKPTGYTGYAPWQIPGLTEITAISAAATRGYALGVDHTVWGWGENVNGALGAGDNAPGVAAAVVHIPGLSNISQISAGSDAAFALTSDGTVLVWGGAQHGEFGRLDSDPALQHNGTLDYSSTPLQVPGLSNVISLGARGTTALAVTS